MNNKKIGLGSAIAVCVGLIVATSCLVSLGTGIGMAGRWFIIPLFLVMFLNAFVGFSFSELHGMMPNVDGGTGQYLLVGVGPVLSMMGNLAVYVVTMMLAACGEIAMSGIVITDLFFPDLDYRIVSIAILIVFFIVNYFGVDVFSKVQNVVVFLLVGSMLVLGIIGVAKCGTGTPIEYANPSLEDVGGAKGLMGCAAIAFWLYIGVEFVIPVAKDMKNPKRDVLLAIIIGLLLLFGVQALLGWGMTNYVTLDILASDPTGMPHMTYAYNLLGNVGRYWMGGITILAAISTMNTVFASTSKVMQGMGEEGMLPKIFGKTNKHNAAVPGMILMAVGIGALVLTNLAASEGITFIILAASCFWLTTYCLIHISVLRLRKKYPDAPRRNWLKMAGIPQIIGILGNIYMIWHIDSGETRTRIFILFGVIIAILAVYSVIWVCGVLKAKPFETVPMEVINEGKIKFDELVKEQKM
ncbi:MAG: APC family permease [Coprococcus sp.]